MIFFVSMAVVRDGCLAIAAVRPRAHSRKPTPSPTHSEVAINEHTTAFVDRNQSTRGRAPGVSVSELHTYAARIRVQIDARTLKPAYGWLEFVARLEGDGVDASTRIFPMTVAQSSSRRREDD